MKLSMNWLKSLVPHDYEPQTLYCRYDYVRLQG